MRLTTKQVAEKLGVHIHYVAELARSGKLATANKPSELGKRVNHEFDAKVVREFAAAWQEEKRQRKAKAQQVPEPAPAPVPIDVMANLAALTGTLSGLAQRLAHIEDLLTATRVELGDRLGEVSGKQSFIDAKLHALLQVWK